MTTPHRITDALNYNEQKVKKGTAECIHAGNYIKESETMNFYQKLDGFENRNMLNDRATTKTLHISLNFDPSEKHSKEKLVQIANLYMEKIGFGEQPYLVYQHHDAGHPHIHIVTTTIKDDGKRINTHNIGRNQSEKARKEIEQLFNLVKAEKQSKQLRQSIPPVDIQKINYGTDETKRSISSVVNAVLSKYKFTSLPELNAALRQYNVIADRGKEGGRIHKHGGLVYRVLDETGNKIGVPVKASSISTKPTLKKLEEKFGKNQSLREPFKQSLKEKIDTALAANSASMQDFTAMLAKEQINIIIRRNAEGRIYGITFIDNKSYCVFNGSDLGKQYSAAGMLLQLESKIIPVETQSPKVDKSQRGNTTEQVIGQEKKQAVEKELSKNLVTEQLMDAKQNAGNIPSQLMKRKRKKKRKNLGL